MFGYLGYAGFDAQLECEAGKTSAEYSLYGESQSDRQCGPLTDLCLNWERAGPKPGA